jgi:cytoskeletal protein CcmA (bactofilin family)
MWGNRNRASRTARIDTLIGEQTVVRGDLEFSGGLHVEGRVVGNVTGSEQAILTLGEQGVIEGEVRVAQMVLNGSVHGDVHAAGQIELAPKARISGNVHYRLLEMSIGAEVNGKLVHETDDPTAAADAAGESPFQSTDEPERL